MISHAATAISIRILLGVPVALASLLVASLLPPGGVLALAAAAIVLAAATLAEARRGNPLGLPAPQTRLAE